jgi:ribosomal protein S18 acetylase RimI-like enzyme
MEIHSLPAEEDAVRRFVEELWLPYHRDLEAAVERHTLADGVDLIAVETEFRLDRLEAESYRTWIVVDSLSDEGSRDNIAFGDIKGEFVGFVATEVDRSPSVFDRPDRLCIGDLYVSEPYRGSGLARDLIDRATERARRLDCAELALDVDVDNDRAVALYEKLGFETYRRWMLADVDALQTS